MAHGGYTPLGTSGYMRAVVGDPRRGRFDNASEKGERAGSGG